MSAQNQQSASSAYYEFDENNFGINFPTGIEAGELSDRLKEANYKVH